MTNNITSNIFHFQAKYFYLHWTNMVTAARSGSAVRAGCCASHAMSRKLSPAVGRNLSTEVTVLRLGRVPSSSLSSRRPETLYF